MKKVLLSLLLAFAFVPMTFGQNTGNAAKEFSTKDTTICSSFIWIDGHEYSSSTVATYVQGNVVYVLNITMIEPVYDTAVAVNVNGNCFAQVGKSILDSEGIHFATMTAADGCDSIIKVNVTLTNTDNLTVTDTACGEYILTFGNWKDTIEATTVAEDNVTLGNCALHRNLNITVYPEFNDSTNVEEVAAHCKYSWNGMTITDTNVAHYKMLTSANGCDSLVAVKVISYDGIEPDTVAVNACGFFAHGTDTVRTDGYYTIVDSTTSATCRYNHVKDITIRPVYTDTAAVVLEQLSGDCKVTWRNHNYTTANSPVYAMEHTATYQCDSLIGMVITSLTGQENYFDTVNFCGKKYPASGKWHNQTFNRPENYLGAPINATATETAGGCEKVYHLQLNFIDNHDTVEAVGCMKYNYIFPARTPATAFSKDSALFTVSGTYNADMQGNALYSTNKNSQCRTDHTLVLTVNQLRDSLLNTATATACDSYIFRGLANPVTLTASTDTNFTISADSTNLCIRYVSHLSLTIYNKSYKDTVAENCYRYHWDRTDQTYTRSTVATKKVGVNTHQCDSLVRLNLTINNGPEVHIEGTWILNPGESTVLNAVNTSDIDASSYIWYVDDVYAGSESSLTIAASENNENKDITLVAASVNGCTDTSWVTVTYNVGIDDVEGLQVSVYPNPASRYLNISVAEPMSEVVVYNAVGQQVLRQEVNAASVSLNLGNLAVGHYTLRILSQDGKEATRKFIVNK